MSNKKDFSKIVSTFFDECLKFFNKAGKKQDNRAKDELANSLAYPSLSEILPYQFYDEERKIFINKKSMGFVLEINPLISANDNVIDSLDDFLRNKLPRNTPLQFTFLSSKEIDSILDYGLKNEKWGGKNADHFNKISKNFYKNATINKFENGRDYNLTLRNYRVFITYAEQIKKNIDKQIDDLTTLSSVIKSSLEGAYLQSNLLNINDFLKLIREISNVDMHSSKESSSNYNEYEEINTQCLDKSIRLKIKKDYIKTSLKNKKDASITETYISQFMISDNPEHAFLWRGANNIGSALTPSLMISSPFIVTFIIEVQNQAKVSNEINTKFLDRNKKAQSKMALFIPSLRAEAQELDQIRRNIEGGKSSLCLYYYNITIFSKNKDEMRSNEQDVFNTYRNNDITLMPVEYMQFRNYLAMYPFMINEDLWTDIKNSGGTNRCEVINAVNLLPIVSDNRLANEGLLAPSFRNQISFINLFNLGTDNFNCAICGTAGAGKSVIAQSLLYDIYNKNGIIWIIDLGDSYKNFCEIVGGKYLDASKLKFNPFANIKNNIDNDKLRGTLSQISKLILVMADPDGDYIDPVMENIIYRAVENAYSLKKNNAKVDDVVDYFKEEREKSLYADKISLKEKMDELSILLDKYTSKGVYGDYFNNNLETVEEDNRLTVLELGGLQSTPDLLSVVLYSLILSIDEKMYNSSRAIMKVCAIDEAWRLLNGAKRVADFIEVGYRTARKHLGSFITITQGIDDFTKSQASQAAWNNSSIKIIAKQDAIAIKTYINNNPNVFKPYDEQILKSFGNASQQKFSSFLLAFNDNMHPCRLFLDPLRRTLFSSTGEDFDYIQKAISDGEDIATAIYKRANIKFGEEIKMLENFKD